MATDNLGFYNVLDVVIRTCRVVASSGAVLEFKHMMLEFNYYEDIFSNQVSGTILINDSVNYLNLLQFDGNERMIISFDNPSKDTPLERSFRLYKVSNRKKTNDRNENYFLHFCSEELLISEQNRISKSYKNKELYKILTSICTDYLKIKSDKLFIEKTIGVRDIIIPSYKPFQAINWLCSLALSKETSSVGTTYLFYESKNGFNFASLSSLFKQKVYRTFLYEQKNLNKLDDNLLTDTAKDINSVISYEHINNFDTLANSNRGAFNNKLITIDPLRGKFGESSFKYDEFKKESPSLNKSGFDADTQNRLGKTAEESTSVVKYVLSTTGQSENAYIKGKKVSVNENRIEQIVPYRIAQLALLNSNKMRLLIPGDVNMTVGLVVKFNLPSVSRKTFGEEEFDSFYSGNYLVTGVRHIVQHQENTFVTVIEICKESTPNSMIKSNNTNPLLTALR